MAAADSKSDATKPESWTGACFCKAVQFEVTATKPIYSAYCHCSICRRLHGAPYVHDVAFPPSAVKVTKGADKLVSLSSSERATRERCKDCGSWVFCKPGGGAHMVGVISANMSFSGEKPENYPEIWKPKVHVWYGNKLKHTRVVDGLPKFKDFPKEGGGTGELVED